MGYGDLYLGIWYRHGTEHSHQSTVRLSTVRESYRLTAFAPPVDRLAARVVELVVVEDEGSRDAGRTTFEADFDAPGQEQYGQEATGNNERERIGTQEFHPPIVAGLENRWPVSSTNAALLELAIDADRTGPSGDDQKQCPDDGACTVALRTVSEFSVSSW
jgi:hypothetical protein